jgi:hypothetical protein
VCVCVCVCVCVRHVYFASPSMAETTQSHQQQVKSRPGNHARTTTTSHGRTSCDFLCFVLLPPPPFASCMYSLCRTFALLHGLRASLAAEECSLREVHLACTPRSLLGVSALRCKFESICSKSRLGVARDGGCDKTHRQKTSVTPPANDHGAERHAGRRRYQRQREEREATSTTTDMRACV